MKFNMDNIYFDKSTNIKLLALLSSLFFVLLAALSRVEISYLQTTWSSKSNFSIFIYFPFIILSPIFLLPSRVKSLISIKTAYPKILVGLFFIFYIVFFIQCLIYVPPVFSGDANFARLEWGFKYVHVLTEIYFRFIVLLILGKSTVQKKISAIDISIIGLILMYTILVVSRSFMGEIIIYLLLYFFFSRTFNWKTIIRVILGFIFLLYLFVLFGNLRQGDDFDISDYGEAKKNYGYLIWFFGYFLVNFDNLALLIDNNFSNGAGSNIFGSILQTLQLSKFEKVDEYLYVGKFNLGTAIRPYVLDFGVLGGGLVFFLFWFLYLKQCFHVKKLRSYYSILFLLIYIGFNISITSRMEQPPYLFSLILICLLDYAQSKKPAV